MKRFHELTKDQQEQAIVFAQDKLTGLLGDGIVVSENRPVKKSDLREVAEAAAEDAWYSEPTDFIVQDIAE